MWFLALLATDIGILVPNFVILADPGTIMGLFGAEKKAFWGQGFDFARFCKKYRVLILKAFRLPWITKGVLCKLVSKCFCRYLRLNLDDRGSEIGRKLEFSSFQDPVLISEWHCDLFSWLWRVWRQV